MERAWASRSTGVLPLRSLAPALSAGDHRDLFEVLAESQNLPPAAAGRLRAAFARERAATIHVRGDEFQGNSDSTMPMTDPQRADTVHESTIAASQVAADPLSQSVRAKLGEELEALDELGRGGMGRVLRVRDRRLGRDAALKLMHNAADPDSIARFLREARVTAGLDHPTIPPIYDAGLDEQHRYYLLMKVIEGQTLRSLIRESHEGRRPPDAAIDDLLEVLVRVAEGLAHAHERGVIHRDIKPDNIMVGPHGEVYLMDWGLARRLDDPEDRGDFVVSDQDDDEALEALTQAGAVMGTPGYMAPEQIGGTVDARADVFALGAVLTEIIANRPPVSGRTGMDRLRATLAGKVRGPARLSRLVPPELDSLACAALELEPERRLASAADFAENLRCYMRGQRLPVHPYTLGERLQSWLERHPWVFAVIFVGVIIAGLVGSLIQSIHTRDRSEQAVALQFQAQEALRQGLKPEKVDSAIEEFLELGDRAYPFLLSAARLRQDEGRPEEAEALLREAAKKGKRPIEALFALHFMELEKSPLSPRQTTPSMRRLLAEVRGSGEAGGYALYARAADLHRSAERARGGARREQLQSAIALYDRFENEVSAVNPYLYLDRALARSQLGDFRGALVDCQRASDLKLDNIRLAHVSAYARSRLGDKAGALADYDHILRAGFPEALERDRDARYRYAQVHLNRGLLLQDAGDPAAALKDFDRALELNPKLEKAALARATSLRALGRSDEAMAALNRMTAGGASSAKTYHNRGHIQAESGKHAAAIADFNEAIRLDPGYAKAWAKRGRSKAALRDIPGALADLEKAIAIGGYPYARLYRAEVYRALDREAEAIADLQSFLRQVPKGARASQARGMLRALGAGRN